MKVLVLGGTHFVGRQFVERALERGDEVTLFNRGRSDPDAFPDVEKLVGDRDGDYRSLAGRRWDVVIDPSAFTPRVVELTCAALSRSVDIYLFVSTTGVYDARTDQQWLDEDSLPATPSSLTSENIHRLGDYGGLKAACERIVAERMDGRSLAIRPGLIAGPGDITDRFTYWPRRIGEGRDVLLPGPPDRPIQIIDVRDLTGWALGLAAEGTSGAFSAVGDQVTLETVFGICREVTGSDARPVWVDEEFLFAEGVNDWTELPLWGRWPQHKPAMWTSNERAKASGLELRPLADTARDTWLWDRGRPRPLHRGPVGTRYVVETLTREREADLLARWGAPR